MIDKLLMVGGGVIEQREGRYWVKAALADYLEEMTRHFSSVAFMGALSPAPHGYATSLDQLGVDAIPWRPSPGGLAAATRQLWPLLGPRTGVWLQLPQTSLFPVIPLLQMKSGRLVAYVANDWMEWAEELRGKGKGWRVPLDNAAVLYPLKRAHHVLVRGPKLLDQAGKYNPRVLESQPIISTRQGFTLRDDSCQGEAVNILFVGKLLLAKGVGVLVQAVARLSRQEGLAQRMRLRLVGEGDDRQALLAMAAAEGLGDEVEFWGFCDDPARLGQAFKEADLLVIPSIESEGMPRVLDEGRRHSLPIVATRVGGISLTYTDGQEVLLVSPGSVEELAQAMGRVIHEPELRRGLIAQSRAHAQAVSSSETAARQHARLLLGREPCRA